MYSNFSPVRKKHHRMGFTLVELLVVIGIIGVLISLLLPALSRSREQARRTACVANLRSLGQAMFLYANSFRDRLPNANLANTWDAVIGGNALVQLSTDYASPGVFHCPSDNDPIPDAIATAEYALPNSARVSYEFFPIWWPSSNGPLLTRLRGQAPLTWDLDGGEPKHTALQNHGTDGGNVLFADGHAIWIPRTAWQPSGWPEPAKEFYPSTASANW